MTNRQVGHDVFKVWSDRFHTPLIYKAFYMTIYFVLPE